MTTTNIPEPKVSAQQKQEAFLDLPASAITLQRLCDRLNRKGRVTRPNSAS